MTRAFFFKVVRNGFILAALYFFSLYSSQDFNCFADFKPIIIFLGTYVFAELANHFKINSGTPRKRRLRIKQDVQTLIL